ncbi:PREDICTED: uncharacterized protein LOC108780305 [Cyphomyrmex costatus]|uniref:uncharacterized protein LOC108780305 n=1 Tax=Cyphomyrmex costatus TaxID=456900 RepID=UPI00085240C5|nr:PREDICTED: uncharacterized protein LOC108780305 [Cyphomyrmex costatus]
MYTEKDKLHRKTIQMLHVKMKKMIKCFKVSLAEEKDKYEAKMYDVLKIVFSPGQIKMLLNPSERKRIVWSSENIASAMELRCVSSKAYRYLRNVQKIPLPSLSTLRKCATSNKKKIGKESFP